MSEKSTEVDFLPPPYSQAMLPGAQQQQPGVGGMSSPVYGFAQQQQPGVIYVRATPIPKHEAPDHLVMAILATICCCLPLGIVAIVKASECKAQRSAGNRDLAVKNSRAARKWGLWSIGIGTVFTIILSVLYYFYMQQVMERMN